LLQTVPPLSVRHCAACARCGSRFPADLPSTERNRLTAAIALAAIILYPIAMTLPMLRIERFGHQNETSILRGIIELLSSGQIIVGVIVLFCSIIFPLGKLIGMLLLTTGGLGMMAQRHKALTYRLIEFTGRWGMLDVLLVAVLVAALKLGNMLEVKPGPAALAFTTCVMLSLLAAATFHPQSVWESET
jgi:paraquat-inducible protein A